MKFTIEYMGGTTDQYWNGTIDIEADDAAQAIRKIENDIACIPASIYAVNPAREVISSKKTQNPSQTTFGLGLDSNIK